MLKALNEPFLVEQFKTWGETEQAQRGQQIAATMPGGDAEIDLRKPEDRVHG